MIGQWQKCSSRFTRAASVVLAGLSLLGCATAGESKIRTLLDPDTAVTATMLPAALEFTSNASNVAPAARIDAQVGPVEINRSGKYYYILWVSAERVDDRGQNQMPSVRLLDGNKLLLERLAQNARATSPLSVAPYLGALNPDSQCTYDLSPAELRGLKIAGRLGLEVSFDQLTWHLLDSWGGSAENFNPLIEAALPAE